MADSLIKFKRGSQAAYDALKNADRVDPDTLYFTYDKNAKDFPGFLYMGITPIAGFGGAPGSIDTISLPEGQTVEEALEERYENPQAGDLCIVDGNLYIYDGNDWVSIYEYIGYPATDDTPATGVYADMEFIEQVLKGNDPVYEPYGSPVQLGSDNIRNVIDDLLSIISALGGIEAIEEIKLREPSLIEIIDNLREKQNKLYWEELEEE